MLFGAIGLVTGPLWARKAWGVWWQWDARLTMSFVGWLISLAYLLLRKYGGPGRKSSPRPGAVRCRQRAVRLPVGEHLAHDPSADHGGRHAAAGHGRPVLVLRRAFLLFYSLLMTARVRLEHQRAALDDLYLADED